jgi:tail length tape measure protein
VAEVIIDITGRDNFSGVLGNFGNIMTGIKSTIDLIGQAFDVAVSAIMPFISAATESQDAVADLEATLKSTGGAIGLTSQQLQDIATNMSSYTRFTDEAIIKTESMLLTFTNIGAEVLPMATAAVLDIATKMGTDAPQAAIQLGKALNDPINGITALTRIGVTFSDQQKEQIKQMVEQGDIMGAQKVIIAELTKEFGGLAEAYGSTFAGKVEILKNRLGEVQETIGMALLPILSELASRLMEYMPTIEDFGKTVADWITEMGKSGVIQEFADKVFDLLGKVTNLASAFLDAGINSTEFREALSAIIGEDFVINADTIASFLDNLDSQLAEAVKAHDWTASGSAFGDMITKALSGSIESGGSQAIPAIGQAIADWFFAAAGVANWNEFSNTFADILQYYLIEKPFSMISTALTTPWIYDLAHKIGEGLLAGLNTIELNATAWVYDHIVKPIKDALGISSPSTVFMEIGQNIILGLASGFMSAVGGLITLVGYIVGLILAPFKPILDLLGIDISGLTTTQPINLSTGGTSTGSTTSSGGGGTVVNQYFAGATINVGSWDQIAYDCMYPNPFVAATSGQLGGGSAVSGTHG